MILIISGRNKSISESSNAMALLYLNKMSTSNCFSDSDRNLMPIFIATNRSGINLDPRGV